MNKKEFKREISMWFGSVINFLKNNPHLSKRYDNIILWACCHDTRFDCQSESRRSQYLFDILCLSGNQEKLENQILKEGKNDNIYQMLEIALLMYKNGNTNAKKIFYKKFNDSINQLKSLNCYDDYYSYLTTECDCIIAADGLDGLEYVSSQIGELLCNYKTECIDEYHYTHIYWEWFDEIFDKEIITEFFNSKSKENKFIEKYYNEYKRVRQDVNNNTERIVPDYNYVIDLVNSLVKEKKLSIKKRQLIGLGLKLSDNDLLLLAKEIENSNDEKRLLILLNIFIRRCYPLTIDRLIQLTQSENKDLVEVSMETLKNFKDKRLHTLAKSNLKKNLHVYESLDLLINNFKDEYEIILKLVKKSIHKPHDIHVLTFTINKLIENNKNSQWLEILTLLYYHNKCTFCRNHVVELMVNIKIIPDDIKKDCLYDCDLDTRELVSNM